MAPLSDCKSQQTFFPQPTPAKSLSLEQHFSVDQLAERWGLSTDFLRKLFIKEPGVVVFMNPKPGKRTYRTLRIPESVAVRVHRRMQRT